MKKITLFLMLIMFSGLWCNTISTIYEELNGLATANGLVAEVQNVTLERDVARFTLLDGDMYLLSEVNGCRMFAIYLGDYLMQITPEDQVAQSRMLAEYDSIEYKQEHDILFLVFTDNTYEELANLVDFRNYNGNGNEDSTVEYCLDYFYNEKGQIYSSKLLHKILNNQQEGYFYAHAYSRGYAKRSDFFEINPANIEEVSVYTRNRTISLNSRIWKMICRFDSQNKSDFPETKFQKDKDEIYVDQYTITASIDKKMDFEATCIMDFRAKRGFGNWLLLPICEKLEISSIKGNDGLNLEYDKRKDSSQLWVNLGKVLQEGEEYKLTVNYGGDLIISGGSLLILESYDYWYPQYQTTELKNFDLTFQYPAKYDLVSVGRQVFTSKAGKIKTDRWVTDYPVNYAPFNMGKFKQDTLKKADLPVLDFHIHKNLKQARSDVVNCVNYYQQIYGKCSYDTIIVADIPVVLSGESYNGLINFYNDSFLKYPIIVDNLGSGNGINEDIIYDFGVTENDFMKLRAHETAHQWWGCSVYCADFNHDRWLYEGLAEFSSIWFLQNSVSNKVYFDMLEEWKLMLLARGSLDKNKNMSDIPLTMGITASNQTIYGKGAWIFHMLRNFMIDLKTFDESSFKVMLQDFFATYKGKIATTADFQKCLEKHIMMDMDWFFDQWIYGSEIPDFSFDYEIVDLDNATFVVKCQVTQQDVSADFISYLPVEFEFSNGAKVRIRRKVVGEFTEFEVNLPQKPQVVKFNIYESVLNKNF